MKKEKSYRQMSMSSAVKERIKSLIFPVILCLIILIGVLVIINYQNTTEEEKLIRTKGYEGDDKPIVMENSKLKFEMDPTTTQFSILVKDTGKVWLSNPEGAAEDPIALTAEKGNLQSTLTMVWSNQAGLNTQYNNHNYSINNGLYEIEQGNDYVKVCYSIGNIEREYFIPPVLTETNYEKWISLMDKEAVTMVKRYYKKYDINNLGKKDDKEALLANYPIMETEVIYVLRDTVNASLCTKMEEFFEAAGYTMEDYAADKELNLAEKSSDKPVFNINMVYRLDGDDLVVELPLKEMESKKEYPIYSVSMLPYFGAGGKTDEGYLVVPEGGGAVINFNNGKNAQNPYYANVYGWDYALTRDAVVHDTRTYFNAFGIVNGGNSMLCILEDGSSYAAIQADISGRYNSFNYANASYSISQREKFDIGNLASSDVYIYIPELPDETIRQRYRFIDSDSYVDMAKEYQNYMLNKYDGYLKMNNDSSAPVSVEILAAVDKVKQVFGVPVSRPLKLTTYKEAAQIMNELYDEGFKNMSVKLSGWCNGGVNQKLLKKVKLISDLGNKKDLTNLSKKANELGVDLYLDGVTQYEYESNIFNGFNSFSDAAKRVSKERAEQFVYSRVTYAAREGVDTYYLLKADVAAQMAKNLTSAAKKFNANVSFREIGKELSADYNRKATSTRENAKNTEVAQLKSMVDDGMNVMINMGNDYAIPYSKIVTNMDLQGSEYTILDATIPFYQIALHGFVNYTGEALNLAGDTYDELLLSAEYGAGLSFTIMKESAFVLQKTLYTEYFGSDYDAWHDRMVSIYNDYNKQLGHTFNQKIVNHEILEKNVSCTEYEDGTKVYVNYNYIDVTTDDGVKVPSRQYKVVR